MLLGLGAHLTAEPQYISTLAGSGAAGFNGDGIPVRSATLYLPQDGAFGPDGDFYFCDWNNHRIRRVRDGVVETVAGTGELGDAQDGPALGVRFNHPTNVAFDSQGRLIIAAWHNSKVKRLDLATGVIVNLAGTGARSYGGDGGPGNDALLDLPSSVAEDPTGRIWISDQANFRLRRLDTSGTIESVCGTGVAGNTGDGGPATAATLRSPVGQSAPPAGRIAIDAEGRVFVADTGNHTVRVIGLDGTIEVVAGTGVAGYSGDDGPATNAQLDTPSDVAVAPDGSLYIADTANNAIRRVSPEGVITTIAGTGQAGFSGDGGLGRDAKLDRPYGVAVGPAGEVVIADTHNHRLRVLTEEPRDSGQDGEDPDIEIIPCTSEIGTICTYAGTGLVGFNGDGRDRQRTHLYWPMDLEFTPSGRVYMLDWNNHRVRQVLPDGRVSTVIGTDFVGDGPADLSDLTPPGALGLTVDLNHPTDVQEFPNGDLLLVAWHNHKFRVLDPNTGRVRVILGAGAGFAGDGGPARDARVNQPSHGVFDAAGNFFFVDQRNQRLRVILEFATLRGDARIETFAGTGVPGFNGDGAALETQFSFPTGSNPEPTGGIALGPDGTIYFADSNNHRIRKVSFTDGDLFSGVVETIAGNGEAGDSGDGGPGVEARINFPQDVEVGPDGKLYFADANNHRVRRVDLATGVIEAVAGTGVEGYSGDGGSALEATFNRPFGISFDPYGNLYVSDMFNSRIRKVKMTSTPEGPEPVLPADYRDSFVEVRDCRFSLEHGGVYIRVLSSPESAAEYELNADPLPVGSVIVKEEFDNAECSDDGLLRWRVMRKEAPGYDPEDNDWHWQLLTHRREVAEDTKDSCIGCHRQIECVRRDYMCTLPGGATEMRPVLDGLPATLLSVSGAPRPRIGDGGGAHGEEVEFEVYAVGADPDDGRGPFVAEYDGHDWRRLETGASGDLWWITDRLVEGDFYLSGADGLILRYEHATGVFERQQTPGGKIVFGVWGTDRQNLWAVGGDLANEDRGGAVWRFNGSEWVVDDRAASARPEGLPTLYKVWGRGPSDVFAVGRLGVALHFDGATWSTIPTGVVRPLFTVHGNETRVAATGGLFDGVILELEGDSFVDVTPPAAQQVNGVFISAGGLAAAVGMNGSFALREATGWEYKMPAATRKRSDFHATWVDPAGGVWAVGGDLTIDLSYGVLAYAGSAAIGRDFVSETGCPPPVGAKPGTVSFSRDVEPILETAGCRDAECHGGALPASGYSLATYESMFGPGDVARNFGMCNIVPGRPDASFLIEKLSPRPRFGEQMPYGAAPLRPDDIAVLRTWILEGASSDVPRTATFVRGDANDDDAPNIADASYILNYLFMSGPAPACLDAADTNDDGGVNISDASYILNFMFLSGPRPPAPFPDCGPDLTADPNECPEDITCG